MTDWTLRDGLSTGGSTGWVRHDLSGSWLRNQKNGYKPEDTVPSIDFDFWHYLIVMKLPATK